MKEEQKKEFLHNPRSAGKSYKALQEFIKAGREGKIAIYRTAQGDFLSPAAVEAYKNEEVKKAFDAGKKYEILLDIEGLVGELNEDDQAELEKITKQYLSS